MTAGSSTTPPPRRSRIDASAPREDRVLHESGALLDDQSVKFRLVICSFPYFTVIL